MAALPETLDLPIGTQIDIQMLGKVETAVWPLAKNPPACSINA